MKVYKIYDERFNKWMKVGGHWTDKEDEGKPWKQKHHAISALKCSYGDPSENTWLKKEDIEEYNKRVENWLSVVSHFKIVVYEIKEVERINYV